MLHNTIPLQNNAPSYNIPPPLLTLYPHAAPHPQIQAYCAPTDQGHERLLPPNSTGLLPTHFMFLFVHMSLYMILSSDFLENFTMIPRIMLLSKLKLIDSERSRKDLMSKMILDIASNDYTSYLANEKISKQNLELLMKGLKSLMN